MEKKVLGVSSAWMNHNKDVNVSWFDWNSLNTTVYVKVTTHCRMTCLVWRRRSKLWSTSVISTCVAFIMSSRRPARYTWCLRCVCCLLEKSIYHDTIVYCRNIYVDLIHPVAVKYIFLKCISLFSVLSGRRAVWLHRSERPSVRGRDSRVLPSDRISAGLRPQSRIRPPWPQACTPADPR